MKISKSFTFEAAHYLPNVPLEHKCGRLHGHSYKALIILDGPVGDTTGWVLDFNEIAQHIAPVRDLLDHRYLNDIVGLDNPTSERLAAWIHAQLTRSGLPFLHTVTVSETCTTAATYP
jgi:6-pyruvoyltetrahydropterin/6-carboxytetrahydropterin synthase